VLDFEEASVELKVELTVDCAVVLAVDEALLVAELIPLLDTVELTVDVTLVVTVVRSQVPQVTGHLFWTAASFTHATPGSPRIRYSRQPNGSYCPLQTSRDVAVDVAVDVSVLDALVLVVALLVADVVAVVVIAQESQRTGQFRRTFSAVITFVLSQSATSANLHSSGSISP
jgi:hypothetical protein